MSGISVAEFAKKIHRSRTGAYYLFTQKCINTELLKKVSDILEYDFFQLYDDKNVSDSE